MTRTDFKVKYKDKKYKRMTTDNIQKKRIIFLFALKEGILIKIYYLSCPKIFTVSILTYLGIAQRQ